jgi:hypothetical protein
MASRSKSSSLPKVSIVLWPTGRRAAFIPSLLPRLWRTACPKVCLRRYLFSNEVVAPYPSRWCNPLGGSWPLVQGHRHPHRAARSRASTMAQIDFCTPRAPTTLLRTSSHPLIVSITIHDTKLGHVLIVPEVALNVMVMHAFEALWIPILGLCLVPPIPGFGYGLMEPYDSISLPSSSTRWTPSH